jgi:hypothetical protein
MTTYTWKNPVSGNWEDAADWSPHTGGYPGTSDPAYVTGATTTTLNETTGDSAYSLYLENPRATIDDFGGSAYLAVYNVYDQTAGAFNVYNNGYLYFEGEAVLDGGSLYAASGGTIYSNQSTVHQDGTSVTLGAGGEIYNSGTWEIENNNGISQTGASAIINDGFFEKTGGGGTSRIAGAFQNNDAIFADSGKLEFQYDVSDPSGTGSALIKNGAKLEFDRAANLNSVDFYNHYGTLSLKQPQNFSGLLENFVHSDTIKLLGRWNETNSYFSGGDTFLTLNHLGTSATLEFQGNLLGALNVHPGAITTITHA